MASRAGSEPPPRPAPEGVEAATREIGGSLLELASGDESAWPDPAWLDEVLLEFCMRHPQLKAQLFRFVDVLPALPPNDVAPHLLEYLGSARAELPAPIRWSVDLSTASASLRRIASRAARRNVLRMARRFIAGTRVDEVVARIEAARRRRLAVTLDALGEAVLSEREADAYRDQYQELLRAGAARVNGLPVEPLADVDHDGRALPRVNVSIKLSALTPVFDPIDPAGALRSVAPRLRAILDAAREAGAFVHVDMEQAERKDLVLEIFREVLGDPHYREFPHVGIVLQAYLRSGERDLEELAAWSRRRGTPVWVRLVKGAYWDSETVLARQRGWPVPVWEHKWETDACYERMADRLLDCADALRPAFASHNPRSLARALAGARARRLPERFVEFQLLYGMADALAAALVKLGQRVRVYMPFGDLIPGMAYLVRRLLENTSNESFVRRERAADESALRPPQPPAREPLRDPEEGGGMATGTRARGIEAPFANEPLRDFSRREVREAFAAALARVREAPALHCPALIAGEAVETAERIESRCPFDRGRVVATSACADAALADRAVEAAAAALPRWRSVGVEGRARALERAADLFAARRDELAAWVCHEAGKPWRDADADVAEAIDFCRYYAREARELGAGVRADVPGEENETLPVPRGPTVVISPWNFPIAIATGMVAAPLVTGNPVVLKPAEQTPGCAWLLHRAFLEAGVPPEVFQLLPGRGEVVGVRLVEHPAVATIAFTGSRAVGHEIARRAAATSTGRVGIKRVVAEMGGKNAIVVDSDADLDEAVPSILASAFGYAGQKCSACSRVVAVGRIAEPLLARLAEAARSLVVGPADEPGTDVGPLIDQESVERVRRYAGIAEREGRVVHRGELGPGTERGHFAAPIVVADVPVDSAVAQEEVFGPLLVVLRASDFDQALAIANATDYALTGGIHSRSPSHIARAREELDVGNLYVNRRITGAFVGRQPFGGHRHSGTGAKAGGRDTLLHFVNAKTISENTLRRGFAPE